MDKSTEQAKQVETVPAKRDDTACLDSFEQGFTSGMGTSNTCCGCLTLSTGVQIIGVLLILNALNFCMTFFQRTGAPCFFCKFSRLSPARHCTPYVILVSCWQLQELKPSFAHARACIVACLCAQGGSMPPRSSPW
jgi:hypothetical protein